MNILDISKRIEKEAPGSVYLTRDERLLLAYGALLRSRPRSVRLALSVLMGTSKDWFTREVLGMGLRLGRRMLDIY